MNNNIMVNAKKKYSERLGFISDEQFQRALDCFHLGSFIKAQPILQGLFGQNVYVTSTKGEFVLRGVPHYPWQFKEEKIYVDLLHDKTKVPVPHPYLLGADTSILGWEFVIMPKMKGIHLSDRLDEEDFTDEDRIGIAKAQGKVLKEAQKLTNTFCGRYNYKADKIVPYETDWINIYKREILEWLVDASSHNSQTPGSDIQWASEVIEKACSEVKKFIPTFYMRDFKPTNMVVEEINGKWQITGLFDLMESSFGHPEADISRMYSCYIERGREDLAYAFIN
ncbi:MAG: phosphotransferase family protein, partial [Candidatus Thorarchaeota archaeon]